MRSEALLKNALSAALCPVLVLAATPALAQQAPVTASSPDGTVSVTLTIDGDGRAARSDGQRADEEKRIHSHAGI